MHEGKITYATVCSGVEAHSLAVRGMDWQPVFFSEIEPFPSAVLAARYPDVPNLGDLTKITCKEGTITNGSVIVRIPGGRLDVLSGGTPCQDVSVAGKRRGMQEGSGTRSALAFHYARLVKELRPRFLIWENVVGVLSSNGGRDFAAFLGTLANLGYSLAWRVLDAQYSRVDERKGFEYPRAVPQRRRRVWLVGYLGTDYRIPGEILFERAGVYGDTSPRRITGEEVTAASSGGAQEPGGAE